MKQFAVGLILVAGLFLAGCGSNSSNASNVNGTWNATLTDSNNVQAFTFGVSLATNSDGSLTVSNFTFNSNSSCFVSGETASGSFTLSGNMNGSTQGTFGFTVKSGTPAGNNVTMTGTVNGNVITGTWSMTGTGCTGTGTFTMNKS